LKEFFIVWTFWMGFTPTGAMPAQVHPENIQIAYLAK
jgi:hypothetical protein